MEKNEEKIKTGWMIPKSIKERFITFCADKGLVAQEDCTGSLFIWQYIPAEIRELAKAQAKGQQEITEEFWNKEFPRAAKNCILPADASNDDLDKIEEQVVKDIRSACQSARNVVVRSKAQSAKQKQSRNRSASSKVH